MRKILTFFAVGCLIVSSIYIASADNKAVEKAQPVEESWDEEEFGPEAPIIWEKPVRTVVFNHKTHTMGAGLDCESCHDDVFEMEAGVAEEDENFTMKAMYEGESCGTCHDGDTAFAASTRCTTCHIGVRGHARLLSGGESGENKASH